ncbi:MAG: glycerol kinase GlpK [Gammaproteobacteria bacterium]|nr:glycerol kinase GlpK [Gammaproteobacteria bacterium]MDH3848470.1 glycerol kinase GlpK [Gammaproteobacteria bacterium]MDH3865035.1 glycerol kinase GlpK [Gammaproteobacteria bacterium]MDH3908016.1 glycerol kinase GlpK [Gammaproteobacteria bacterium]NCF58748.1 glycerol kinase GlpK [Gammaproteobacteria bacterium]
MTKQFLLAIDQGTSSSRTVIYDDRANVVASAQQEFRQIYPESGWVEHDPEEIWASVRQVTREALAKAGITIRDIAGIGITNQRETTVVWDRRSGECIYNAIVWQDRRTAAYCRDLRERCADEVVAGKTGLRLDPYFSATKVAWILNNVDGARRLADDGHLAFGTIDSFLLWRLTGGAVHATDATNASRTMLFNIHAQAWDDEMLELLEIPASMLPEVLDCAAEFGSTSEDAVDGAVPICGIAGDQQAALIGQAGFEYGMTKSTYGTGCFAIANTGNTALTSHNQLLTTVASRIGGEVTYGLEGSVFVAGSALQWLRDELRIIDSAPESEQVAARTGVVDDVYVVPAFAGLGAPYWDPDARGAIVGLSRGSGRDQIVTATLQAVAYQTRDLIDAMADDGISPSVIRVDGGMAGNEWFLQFLADILDIRVERPANVESTVLGAAYLAALQCGLIDNLQQATRLWRCDAVFEPRMTGDQRDALLAGWATAVARVRGAS